MPKIFLTGGTGVLGREIVRLFLKKNYEVHLLVRGGNESEFLEKSDRLAGNFEKKDLSLIKFYHGDVSQAQMGLSEKEYKQLLKKIDYFIHCAGEVKLSQSKEEALNNSLETIKNVCQFSIKSHDLGALKKLDIVSTVGVAGKGILNLPERFIGDEDFDSESPVFHNFYEYGKYHAERYLEGEMLGRLPLTVHRPSMIVGDSKTGQIGNFQVFYHICEMLLGKRTFGILPNLSGRTLDIIPVDFVARAIVESSLDMATSGKVFNLCSGPELAIPLDELTRKVRDIFENHGQKNPPFIVLPKLNLRALQKNVIFKQFQDYVPELLPKTWQHKVPKSLKSLKPIFEYLNTDQRFLNSEFVKLLDQNDLKLPPVDEYLDKVLDYYIENKYVSELETSDSKFVREIEVLEFFRDRVWPTARMVFEGVLTPRCQKCAISSKAKELVDGVCKDCIENKLDEAHFPSDEDKILFFQTIHKALEKKSTSTLDSTLYDALVLFSGGKDSTYMIHRLRQDYPKMRILALTVDNTFMSPVALVNIKKVIQRLKVDHQIVRPSRFLMRKMFAFAFRNLNEKGGSGTVDQFDGDFFHDVARNYAYRLNIPLIFSGLSPYQVERILGLNSFLFPKEEDVKKRTHVAGIPLSSIFTEEEMQAWWWDGSSKNEEKIPRMLFPFYVWSISEEEIKKQVIKSGFIDSSEQSPLLTNNRLIPLMSAVDFAQFGYSSFEPEFSRNIRQGYSDPILWRNTFEIAELAASTGLLLDSAIGDVMQELGLSHRELGLPKGLSLKGIDLSLLWKR